MRDSASSLSNEDATEQLKRIAHEAAVIKQLLIFILGVICLSAAMVFLWKIVD